jgi:hypothetical protein
MKSCIDVLWFAQRTLAECTHFLCARGAPKVREFCNSFARF